MGSEASVVTPELQVLDLSGKKLTQLPSQIPRNQLRKVDLSRNAMRDPNLPQGHPTIQCLSLSDNKIDVISPTLVASLLSYPKLRSLKLSKNGITELPKPLSQMKKLKKLMLFSNKLVDLEVAKSVIFLDIGNNRMVEIPKTCLDVIKLRFDFNHLITLKVAMPRIEYLSLAMVGLEEIEEGLVFSKLLHLNVEKNRLRWLPDLSIMAPQLMKLNAQDNFLRQFPKVNTQLIVEIIVSMNRIVEVPMDLVTYAKLSVLDVSDNLLELLPTVPWSTRRLYANRNVLTRVIAAEVPVMEVCHLSNNKLNMLPQMCGDKIVDMRANDNNIAEIDMRMMAKSICNLELNNNKIQNLPTKIAGFRNLARLLLADNNITQLPDDISECQSLMFLNVSGNPLEELPTMPTGLQYLYASECGLDRLPDTLINLSDVTVLCVSGNNLVTFPVLGSVKTLVLSQNKIERLPKTLPRNLQLLDLSYNRLETLSPISCGHLWDLDLSCNRLTVSPDLKCPKLKCLKLAHNPIQAVLAPGDFGKLGQLDICETGITFTAKPGVLEWLTTDQTQSKFAHANVLSLSDGVGQSETRGTRERMEDALFICAGLRVGVDVFGVFDGHGGRRTSLIAPRILKKMVAGDEHFVFSTAHIGELIEGMARDVVRKKLHDGSTMAIAFLSGKKLISGHLGDSRVLLVDNVGGVRFVTVDHKATSKAEYERVCADCGYVENDRVGGTIAMARAIGDDDVTGMTHKPDMREIALLEKDKWLIAACDGVFDALSNEETASIAMRYTLAVEAAHAIRNAAFARGSADNISVVVVDLTPYI